MKRITLAVVLASCGGKGEHPVPDDEVAVAAIPAATSPPAVLKGHPSDDLIPRAVLSGNPERDSVQISPDGKHLSWRAPKDGILNVWVAPTGALDRAKPITAETSRPVSTYVWAFDDGHLLYLRDQAGDENFHLFRVDVETAETVDLTPIEGVHATVVGVSPKVPGTIAISLNDRDPEVSDLYRVDLANGERTLVAKNDQRFSKWHVDRSLELRFAEKTGPDGSIELLVRAGPKWKRHDLIPPADTLTFGVLGFDHTGNSYYTFDARERDTAAIYEVDARSKQKHEVFSHAEVDLTALLFHPADFEPQAVLVNRERPDWVALDERLSADLTAIGALGEGAASIVSRTLDDQTWIVELVSDTASTKYFRWDHAAKQGELLFSAQPLLDAQPLVPMHPVVIRARDGLALVSYLSLPREADADADGKADHPVPMVLAVHGGPDERDRWGFDRGAQWLANRGYAVLSVNFRGSYGFGKKFLNAGDGQWGKRMHDDLLDAVEWAVAQKVAPRDRVCIAGVSYGGYATLVGLAMTPDVFACGVDGFGISNLITFLETIPPYWSPEAGTFFRMVGDPRSPEGRELLRAASPLTHAAAITKPLLIAQGKNDARVKQAESDQIVAAMVAKHLPVGYVLFPDEGHGFQRPANIIAFTAVIEAFLSVHLGGWYEPITAAELEASSMVIVAGRDVLPGLP